MAQSDFVERKDEERCNLVHLVVLAKLDSEKSSIVTVFILSLSWVFLNIHLLFELHTTNKANDTEF